MVEVTDTFQRKMEQLIQEFSEMPREDQDVILGTLSLVTLVLTFLTFFSASFTSSDSLDDCFTFLLSARLLFAHYNHLRESLATAKDGNSPPPAKSSTPSPPLPTSISQRFNLTHVLCEAIEDAKGFSIEKHGLAPRIRVRYSLYPNFQTNLPKHVPFIGPPAYIHFIMMELLKNATTALIDRHQAINLDTRAPPIVVDVAESERNVLIRFILSLFLLISSQRHRSWSWHVRRRTSPRSKLLFHLNTAC